MLAQRSSGNVERFKDYTTLRKKGSCNALIIYKAIYLSPSQNNENVVNFVQILKKTIWF